MTLSDRSTGTHLGVFAKFWAPGEVKTRLAVSVGPVAAAEIHKHSLASLLVRLQGAADSCELIYAPADQRDAFAGLIEQQNVRDWQLTSQANGDLGARMQSFFDQALEQRQARVVLIGSDSPTMPDSLISQAFELLTTHQVVLGPSCDGGYYLVGARDQTPPIFSNMAWSSETVFAATTSRLDAHGLSFGTLPPWYDIDDIEDLRRLQAELRQLGEHGPLAALRAAVDKGLGTKWEHRDNKTMNYFLATSKDRSDFERDGYILVPQLLKPAEVQHLADIARQDARMQDGVTERADMLGNRTLLAVRDSLQDDVYAKIVRSQRVAESMRVLMDEEVYHYHHKLMLKEPRVGGAWEWHQDYGYWYNYGCLFPRMASCYIAIDRACRENGCLQILPGSHLLGRIEHGKVGGQTGVDPERLPAVLARFPLRHVDMEPGDGLFFHANLLHRSDQNTSDMPRWSLICCYNTRSNSPYEVKRHNGYSPLDILPDEQIFGGAIPGIPGT